MFMNVMELMTEFYQDFNSLVGIISNNFMQIGKIEFGSSNFNGQMVRMLTGVEVI